MAERELKLWRQKLVQILHDPPGKVFFIRPGSGGHKHLAADIFQAIADVPLKFIGPPDRAAAGADRPVISPPSRQHGSHPISVDWVMNPVLTHPLSASVSMEGKQSSTAIRFHDVERPRSSAVTRSLAEDVKRTLAAMQQHNALILESEEEDDGERREMSETTKLETLPLWNELERIKEACWRLWRRLPTTTPAEMADVLWLHQPADSRVPDHSLWDHLRVTSALAFVSDRKLEGATMPWLLAFSIGPVQRFIAESRTSSDLWTTSMLFSDLVWHAMVPFIEHYGPEAIVYPDLRGNPRADQWLREQQERGVWRDVLPDNVDTCSYAGMFPNTFVALLPRGSNDELLEPLENVATRAREAVRARWKHLADLAKLYFITEAELTDKAKFNAARSAFETTWARQHDDVVFTVWTATAWPRLEKIKDPSALSIPYASPAQTPAPSLLPEDQQAVTAWQRRHDPWIPQEPLAAYARARHVYARTNLGIHQSQRGFDYPLIHHALQARHSIRKAEAQASILDGEAGEKCTLCGLRQALGNTSTEDTIDNQRQTVREFWRLFERSGEGGKERLCAVCTMKRVLVRAGKRNVNGKSAREGLTNAWAGSLSMEELLDEDQRLRVPFPSTATIAAQIYLRDVVVRPELRAEVAEVVRCCNAARLPRTTFVRALRSLAEIASSLTSATEFRFLEFEAELTAFPEVMQAWEGRAPEKNAKVDARDLVLLDAAGEPVSKPSVEALRRAVETLRREAQKHEVRPPNPQIAVITLDGDGIRKLLLGTHVEATWRDVIHPFAVKRAVENDGTIAAGWPDLLDTKRLLGPSTHAFINRVLATFVHTIVPWVVEREFEGRLIYAGGDDVLALAPAEQALDIAARLAQLYSAAWILDTQPNEAPWGWRRKGVLERAKDPASRFVVVAPSYDGPIPWPIPDELRRSSIASQRDTRATTEKEHLLPMMGSGQTLSAGIAIGHYKTSLGSLVRAAWEERERAKGKLDDGEGEEAVAVHGNAFSIRRYTRGGEKASLRLPWGEPSSSPDGAFGNYKRVKRVIETFRTGDLAGRVPYKLREIEDAVLAACLEETSKIPEPDTANADELAKIYTETVQRIYDFARGIFVSHVGTNTEDAYAMWWHQFTDTVGLVDPRSTSKILAAIHRVKAYDRAPRNLGSEQGLAVCRFLGALVRGDEEDPP